MKIHPLYFCLASFSLLSCKTEVVIPKKTEDRLMLLTSRPWKPSLTDKNSQTNPTGSFTYSAPLSCEFDDQYNFSTRNKITITRGQNQCNPNESSPELVDYTLTVDAKHITINGTVYNLAEISEKQLKYYHTLPTFSGGTMIYLFEH